MTQISETGHGKNAANFKKLITCCNGLGDKYNPVKGNLRLDALERQWEESQAVIKGVHNGAALFNKATNTRSDGFKDFKQYGTRVTNALAVSGASAATIADAKGINRKIQGRRAEAKPIQINPEDEQSDTKLAKTISVSQQSYDARVEHLATMHELLLVEKIYKPNEAELTTDGVSQKLRLLLSLNENVATAYTQYSNSRIARDSTLYNPLTGLVAIAQEVKKYVLSVFGANSPQYKQVNSIEFKTIKSKS
jgi:hypothetical protein